MAITQEWLRAILNKSWQQHPTRHQLYGHLPPITKTIQVRRTRHAGHCWRSRDELIRDVLLWIPTHRTTSSNVHSAAVRIQVVVLKTYLGRWTIGRSGERGSGISVLPARYDHGWWWWWWRLKRQNRKYLCQRNRRSVISISDFVYIIL